MDRLFKHGLYGEVLGRREHESEEEYIAQLKRLGHATFVPLVTIPYTAHLKRLGHATFLPLVTIPYTANLKRLGHATFVPLVTVPYTAHLKRLGHATVLYRYSPLATTLSNIMG